MIVHTSEETGMKDQSRRVSRSLPISHFIYGVKIHVAELFRSTYTLYVMHEGSSKHNT